MKVIIIGGVAGGASAAARLRRLDETAEIILLERGEYVSFANCGLPYYIGGEITQKSALTVQTPESLHSRLNLDVRTGHEAVAIDTAGRQVEILNLKENLRYSESYDKLILSPGAEPIRPALPGVDDRRVFTLRNIPDTYRIDSYIKEQTPRRALVVGGGFIGLEMAENLVRAGLRVTVAEKADHVIASLDREMAADVHRYLDRQGVKIHLENGVRAIEPHPDHLHIKLDCGELDTDLVLLSIGVRPEGSLAKAAGLALNERGAIITDQHMRTSDPHIYAVGDAVEVQHQVTGQPAFIPLAGPANKQGRIAADHIAGISRSYHGTQGSAIVKLFDMTVAATGISEAAARSLNLDYDKVYLLTASHAGYYPGAAPLHVKVLFEKTDGRILGAQIVGSEGVDKRIDVLAAVVRHQMTAEDLTELELSYAPPYSSAKDPVNMVGFMIQNLLEDNAAQYHWNEIAQLQKDQAVLIDVRTSGEYAAGHIEGAENIPLDDLRSRLTELDQDRPVYLYCQSGHRSYLASRILSAHGYQVSHLSGGYYLYSSAILSHGTGSCCS